MSFLAVLGNQLEVVVDVIEKEKTCVCYIKQSSEKVIVVQVRKVFDFFDVQMYERK